MASAPDDRPHPRNQSSSLISSSAEITPRETAAYGLLALPLAALGVTFYVYLPKFYSDYVGIDLQVLSVIIIASRMWDAVIDPLIGALSDRTSSRFGRRRSWIGAATIPLLLTFWLLLVPPQLALDHPIVWLGVLSFSFFLCWTSVAVPYEALGAELVQGYDARTRLLAFRDGMLVVGTLLAGIVPATLESLAPQWTVWNRFAVIAAVNGVLFLAAAPLCILGVKERTLRDEQRPTGSLLGGWQAIRGNRPFVVLLISYSVSAFGGALPATLILFYAEHVLGSSRGSQFLVLYLLVGVLFLPVWIRLAARFDKRNTWVAAMLINTLAFAAVFPLGTGDTSLYAVLVTISAIGYGATLALPSSMQVDVIDYDELICGRRREGQIIGLWNIAKQLSAALGTGAALWILGMSGYLEGTAGKPVAQPESAVLALRVLYAAVPAGTSLIAIGIALFYTLGRDEHRQIREQLDRRVGAAGPAEGME